MNPTDTIRRNDDLLTTEVDGELLAMSIEQSACFALNPVGTEIWKLIETPQTVDAITATLLERFDVTEDVCRREIGEFLDQMQRESMIVVTPAG